MLQSQVGPQVKIIYNPRLPQNISYCCSLDLSVILGDFSREGHTTEAIKKPIMTIWKPLSQAKNEYGESLNVEHADGLFGCNQPESSCD